jgi:hypothetical protein
MRQVNEVKEVVNEAKEAFEATIRFLEAERVDIMRQLGPLQVRLREVQSTQTVLLKRIVPDAPSQLKAPLRPTSQKYARISVRWAILDLLNESDGMSTSEITEALTAGGIQTRALNFANNVSAVLSTTMQKGHNEVESLPDGRWKLTANGVSAIAHIRMTDKFRRGCGSWAS